MPFKKTREERMEPILTDKTVIIRDIIKYDRIALNGAFQDKLYIMNVLKICQFYWILSMITICAK